MGSKVSSACIFDCAETVYGLGANALSEEAVLKIFQVRFPRAREAVERGISRARMSLSDGSILFWLLEVPPLYWGNDIWRYGKVHGT